MHDIIIIGAGPVGLATAIDARRAGLSALVIDKGALVNSIVGYPARMEFFSTPDLIEIGGHPFPVQGYKPTREEGLEYYRGVAAREGLELRLYERVRRIARHRAGVSPSSPTRASIRRAMSSSRWASTISPTCSASRARTCRRSRTTTASRIPTSGRRSRSSARRTPRPRPRSTVTGTAPRSRCSCAAARCRRRSSTGSSPTSRTASRRAASVRYFNTSVVEIRAVVDRGAHTRGESRNSRTTGCSR